MRLSDEGFTASPDCVSWVSPAEELLHSNRWHLNSGLFKNLASGYESLCEIYAGYQPKLVLLFWPRLAFVYSRGFWIKEGIV